MVSRPDMLGDAFCKGKLTKLFLFETHREGVDFRAMTGRDGHNEGGVDSPAEETTDGNIGE